ncbi:MAG: hypothetical protein LUG18_09345 [Candidatus Azobacteroides sp.]|nr:hypothetical protein [Candidatus Azobacteroides sp.]
MEPLVRVQSKNITEFTPSVFKGKKGIEIVNYESVTKLSALNDFLSSYDLEVGIHLDTYSKNSEDPDHCSGMDMILHLPNVKRLNIFGKYWPLIKNMDQLSTPYQLEEIELRSNFANSIDFSPLTRHSNLRVLKTDFGLSGKQMAALENFPDLEELAAAKIDLEKFPALHSLTSLCIYTDLKNLELINTKFPNLENLYLKRSKSVANLNLIGNIPNLKSLQLLWMTHATKIPEFSDPAQIKLLEGIGLKNLEGVSTIDRLENLEGLMLTELAKLKAEDFKPLQKLKKLKAVYITFKDQKEEEKMMEFVESNNWVYCQPDLLMDT